MMNLTTTSTINVVLDKKAIVERLFKAGHITMDELLELMKEPSLNFTIPAAPWPPFNPNPQYPVVYCSSQT